MYYFLFFVMSVYVLALTRSSILMIYLVLGCCIALYLLPDTGFDYIYYQIAFENSYLVSTFPWFETNAILTAEPLYIWYSSLVGVATPFNFPGFLVLNFIVCFTLFKYSSRSLKADTQVLFWLAFLPVIFPTIFYFSPRSSISFFFIVIGIFIGCSSDRIRSLESLYAFGCLVIGMSIHSQYILVSIFIVFYYLMISVAMKRSPRTRYAIVVLSIVISVGAVGSIDFVANSLAGVFRMAGASNVAIAKLHLLETAREGTRGTAVLSILVFPLVSLFLVRESLKTASTFFFRDKGLDNRFVLLLACIIFVGMAVNIVYFNVPHLSGRLSRFSDYVGFALIIPAALVCSIGYRYSVFVLAAIAAVSPFLYPTLYLA